MATRPEPPLFSASPEGIRGRRLRRGRFCCSEPVPGPRIYEPSRQMHNRGNGKGGGIAAVGLVPEQLGVSREAPDSHYLLHVAFVDPNARAEIEQEFITPLFDVAASAKLDQVRDWKVCARAGGAPAGSLPLLRPRQTARPGSVQGKEPTASARAQRGGRRIRNQNSFSLNQKYYASLGEKRAFVLSTAGTS